MNKEFSFKNGNAPRALFHIFNMIFFVLLSLVILVPMYKVLVDSLDIAGSYGLQLLPTEPSLAAYKMIITQQNLRHPLLISFYTTVFGTMFGLLLCTLGAYVLIQYDMPGRTTLSYFLLFTMIFEGGMVPTFLVMKQYGLLNTLWAVILPMSMNVYNLILMRNFFEGIPRSLYESADLDGCTPMGIFWRIVLPLSKPALASIGLFYAVAYWGEYTKFTLYINDSNLFNFQVKLRSIILSDDSNAAATSLGINSKSIQNAAIIVGLIPMAILYPFCQKYFVTGVTMGAVKE